ncbi:MAG: hypothetical protein C4521_11285 [Actinobacteria bacterium]|nr:MAG: hypothetical protein C4521_11285 [Actinomycetota bacterium]
MGKKSAKKKAPSSRSPSKGQTASSSQKKPAKTRKPSPTAKAKTKATGELGRGGIVSAQVLKGLDTATYVMLHVLVVAVPLAFGQFTFDQFDMPKVVTLRLVTLLLMGLWGTRFLLSRKIDIRRTPLDWLALAFIVWVTLSTVFSVHVPTALLGKYRRYEGYISLVNYAVVFFIAVQTLRDYARLVSISKTMVLTGAAVGAYGIAQAFGKDFLQWGQLPFDQFRAFSTYGNPDLLVGYLGFLVPVGIGLFLIVEDKWESAGYGLSTVIVLTSMLLTFSRSAWVGLFFAFIYMGVLLWRQGMVTRPRVLAMVACILVIAGALTVYTFNSPNQVTSLYARTMSLLNPNEGSAGTRLDIWQSAVNATLDTKDRPWYNPLLGFGPDTFRLVFPKYKTASYVTKAGYRSVADNVHNYPLQLASGVGIVGLALFGALVLFGLYKAGRFSLAREEDGPDERILIGSFVAAAITYAGHLVFGLSVTGTTIFLWLAFAAYMMPLARVKELEWKPSSAVMRVLGLGVLMLAVVAGLFLNNRFFQADRANLRSYQFQSMSLDQALAAETEALRLNPYWDAYRAQKAMLLLNDAETSRDRESLEKAIDFLRESIERTPREYDNYLFLANAYSMAARLIDRRYEGSMQDLAYEERAYGVDDPANVPQTALGVALYALKNVEPNAPSAMVQAALSSMSLQNRVKALELMQRATRMDPNYAEAFYHLGGLYESMGKKEAALDSYKHAILLRQQAQRGDFPEAAEAIRRLEGKAK